MCILALMRSVIGRQIPLSESPLMYLSLNRKETTMGIMLYGHWAMEVTKAIHSWENRYVIEGASTGSGVYPPTVGDTVTANGSAWQLRGEYRKSDSDPWLPSAMIIEPGIERVDIQAMIGSEDPLPHEDYEDIQWDAHYLGGTMFEIPYRPFAIRTDDLFQMPDGIFETILGEYYMGVRVVNRWGLPFTKDNVLDISAQCRVDLLMRGIQVIDSWTQTELASLGQTQKGTGMVLGPMVPGQARTVYFKVNVSQASPRKHEVEFVCRNMSGMADPNNPSRYLKKQVFVSSTRIDTDSGIIVSELQEGTLQFKLKEFAFDQASAKAGRRKCPPTDKASANKNQLEKLRETLQDLLAGKAIDPCLIQQLLACYCSHGPNGSNGDNIDPRTPYDGRFCYDPFYAFPTKFSYTITPRSPFAGQYGPIPYDDPWWKVLLIIIAVILLIAGAIAEAADIAYQDEDLVIGTLGDSQADDVDAALCVLDTDRALAFLQTLDAQSDEDLQNAIISLDGNIDLVGPIMTRAELDTIMFSTAAGDPQRKIHKSGARTGLTHAVMSGFAPIGHGEVNWTIDQLLINRDPDFDELVSQGGDSGSIWVHTSTLRPIALHHSGDDAAMIGRASLLEDVQSRMNITI